MASMTTPIHHLQEQEMEIEAIKSMIMDEFEGLSYNSLHVFHFIRFIKQSIIFNFKNQTCLATPKIHPSESGLNTSN